ncbi:phosphate acyltransferase PlsX [Ketogulonicigenium vulgare]|uniref:Phosphate acyltransferase n=1 Tax=Ketogulonicigenium vulgare (strain WSH-001) TaxID=759362 RepID=F9Y5G1_KETVW|nr:phosphate acyltransferase PlsX [Ketogulonicigenium vulgare]ADO42517.1 fatty acid/phospholipid synthesis protein PlsX [Ketogulonicigenium vulgare Y25]AEM40714.1 Fatty acid/phospholipid synthesis protein [Ketogulonicigenium vulgare WSH-001]ALJ80884.1 phosphate acyltransferase [Ketogulonicigenium vulgare]ANW33657.1 phosphate acyltransferase [Ketogulonicigenium vulgare]AOZ54430.1 fatty acid/phospholipid synthesis protein PlsX [Ketogulonicigenium vulgare]
MNIEPQGSISAQVSQIVISVDAMGGDKGPAAVVAGLDLFLASRPDAQILLHGNQDVLNGLVAGLAAKDRITIIHAQDVVQMTDKPAQVIRTGKNTSMWSALDSVREGAAAACISCGNTGALMALSTMRLRRIEGVKRPAIACMWPSLNPSGFNILLDAGADLKADAPDLLNYAFMGASYARNGLGLTMPRVGLLNVGTEEHKGRAELREAHDLLTAAQEAGGFDYVGFVEGGDIPMSTVDVIVTDGFTGNVALKTGEGTARLVAKMLRDMFGTNILSKLAAILAYGALKKFRHQMDPRRVNGGVFLGLNGTVVKSHGSSDATSFAAAISQAYDLAKMNFTDRVAARLATSASFTAGLDSAEPATATD